MENTRPFKTFTLDFEHADDSPIEDNDIHNISAFSKKGNVVGKLDWNRDTGAIDVEVKKKHRRKGLATAMYDFATDKAEDEGIQAPSLGKSRYGMKGLNWARSLGYKGGHNNRLDENK